MAQRGSKDDTQLVNYVTSKLWSSPEENNQYQLEVTRVTPIYGVNRTFGYMNKWRHVPIKDKFYHIFTAGGLNQGYWNFNNEILNRNPFDKWVSLGELCLKRGINVDVYDTLGLQYPRQQTWVMKTYDGLTLIAIQKLRTMPIKKELNMFLRCYTPNVYVDKSFATNNGNGNPFVFKSLVYESGNTLVSLDTSYRNYDSRPGYTTVFINGVMFNGSPLDIKNAKIGDIVELWHDPTVIRTELYDFADLTDFYSELDKKRKVILHPPKNKGEFRLRYFDDNDYYLVGPNGFGLYFHRNDVGRVRQLTHVDVAIAEDAIRSYAASIPDLDVVNDIKILVIVRDSDWRVDWPNEHQRLRYLYRLPDQDIVKAFTGARANMDEWTAKELEIGPVMSLTRGKFTDINRECALRAVGYNASTRVLSENVIRAEYELGSRGVEVPFSYRGLSSAWEYTEEGKLIGFYNLADSKYYSPVNPECKKVEFVIGEFGRELDLAITNENVELDPNYDYRIYTSPFSIATGDITNELTDITDDSTKYEMNGNLLVWTGLDKVNTRGVVISNRKSLAYSFTLDHLDKSLSFGLTHLYEPGGLQVPLSLAQVDVWLNGSPLIDGVDWLFKDQKCYIINKEFIVPGVQQITVRAHGFTEDLDNPRFDNELGFIDGGVIGRFERYNLRGDRTTRTIINGCLHLTDEVARAEREVPDDQWNSLNGKPYSVKHVLTPIVGVEDFKNYPGFDLSRDLDRRVSDYLTKYLPKPTTNEEEITWETNGIDNSIGSGSPVNSNLQDKYRLFSPFMNALVNSIVVGLVNVPKLKDGQVNFSSQDISELVRSFIWWLEFDPVTLKFDRRYFAIMPYSNFEKLTVTSDEFVFIKQVNDIYLESVCSITGHFDVNDNL